MLSIYEIFSKISKQFIPSERWDEFVNAVASEMEANGRKFNAKRFSSFTEETQITPIQGTCMFLVVGNLKRVDFRYKISKKLDENKFIIEKI